MKKTGRVLVRILAVMLSVSLLPDCFGLSAFAAEAPSDSVLNNIVAEAVVLADLDSGVIIYEKNMEVMRSPASLTKIMTGLLAVEAVENGEIALDDVITAPADCWTGMDLDSSNAEILPGEKMTFKDYLYCAMVKSANEACNIIAVAVDGSIQAFVNRMNLRANELGATHTFFSDPNGLSDTGHYTTAHDLFLITREAMQHEIFVDAVNTIDYEIEETNMHAKRYLNSSNALLCQDGIYGDGYLYLPASGVKTGYTEKAGYCLVSTASKNDMNLCAVVLGCGGVLNTGEDGYGNFSSTIKLYDWAFSNCRITSLVAEGEVVSRAPVQFAKDNATVELRTAGKMEAVLPKNIEENRISTTITTYDSALVAPVEENTILGKLRLYIDGTYYGEVDLFTANGVEADTKKLVMHRVGELMDNPRIRIPTMISGVLILLIVIIFINYRRQKRIHYLEIVETEEHRREERERLEDTRKSLVAQEQMNRIRQKNGSEEQDK